MKASEFFVRKHDPKPGMCFVLMPFQEALTAVYEHGIKPQVDSMGMQCKRADEIYSGQSILDDIWTSIQTAEFIIVDCTGNNPNVMYEIGLCHALWKKIILLSQSVDDLPFDLRQWRVIRYDFTFAGVARLKEDLGRAIKALKQEKCVEANLVELPVRYPAKNTRLKYENNQQWLHGKIEIWKPERRFGFAKSGDEYYWFNLDSCFFDEMVHIEDAKVTFIPLPPLPNAKRKRASSVFIENAKLQGKVTNISKSNGFAFAMVNGNHCQNYSIFLETGRDSAVTVGSAVEFVVSSNKAGPICSHVKVVDTVS